MSKDLIYSIIFVITIIIQFHMSKAYLYEYLPTLLSMNQMSTQAPCGQYGFRCVNKKSYQICNMDMDDDDEKDVSGSEPIYECSKGLRCDEDNSAFCTPMEIGPYVSVYENKNDNPSRKNSDYYEIVKEKNHKYKRLPFIGRVITQLPIYGPVENVTPAPPYNCEHYGFFPDASNRSRFWFCDISRNGKEYVVRHMLCGHNKIFDPIHNMCMSFKYAKTRNIKDSHLNKRRDASVSKSNNLFCDNKAQGKYSNDEDCQTYYFCPSKISFIKQVLLTCPSNTAFDPNLERCTTEAIVNNCLDSNENKNQYSEQKLSKTRELKLSSDINNCKSPSKFRENGNCKNYFIYYENQVVEMQCPRDQKFDDVSLKCVPEKFARCSHT